MNARERIKQEISQLADGLKSRRPLAEDLRAIDALLADFTIYAQEYAPVRLSLLLERSRALGYSPKDTGKR